MTESTAVATAKPAIPHEIQRGLDERKLRNIVASKIAGMSWGGALDKEARGALADWGQQHGVDVTREIFILGNRLYLNAEYYINRAQAYVRAGIFTYSYRYINVDKRLDAMAAEGNADAAKERDERAMLRIQYNAPEGAHSTVLFLVRLTRSGDAVAACKWAGGGVRKGDPVGDSNPESTALTRAARKALKMVAGHEPEVAIAYVSDDDDSAIEVESVIHRSQSEQKALAAEVLAGQRKALRNITNEPALKEAIDALPVMDPHKGATMPDAYDDEGNPALFDSAELTDAEIEAMDARGEA